MSQAKRSGHGSLIFLIILLAAANMGQFVYFMFLHPPVVPLENSPSKSRMSREGIGRIMWVRPSRSTSTLPWPPAGKH